MKDRSRAAWLSLLLLALPALPGAAGDEPTATICQRPGLDPALIEEARRLLTEVPLVDGHNDLPWVLRRAVRNQLAPIDLRRDLREQLDRPTHTDVPRLRAGGVGAQFWSVWVPVDQNPGQAVQTVLEQIDLVHRLGEHYPDVFELALTANDVRRIHRSGRIASLVGMEGGHSIADSLAVLRQFYALGARYMTLTHVQNLAWADSATDEAEHDGLTDFGREVVREMNRLGMMVDLSHVSAATMHDVLDLSEAPVVFSHSGAAGVTPHPRNVPDAVLDRLRENGGIVMVTFVPSFVSAEAHRHRAARLGERERLKELHPGAPEAAAAALTAWDEAHPRPAVTVGQVADHCDYVRDRIGIAYLGIGSDFDGFGYSPQGLEDVSCFPALLAELLGRGYTREEVMLVAGNNLLRVMQHVESVAARLREERRSSEVLIEDLDRPGSDHRDAGRPARQ